MYESAGGQGVAQIVQYIAYCLFVILRYVNTLIPSSYRWEDIRGLYDPWFRLLTSANQPSSRNAVECMLKAGSLNKDPGPRVLPELTCLVIDDFVRSIRQTINSIDAAAQPNYPVFT